MPYQCIVLLTVPAGILLGSTRAFKTQIDVSYFSNLMI